MLNNCRKLFLAFGIELLDKNAVVRILFEKKK